MGNMWMARLSLLIVILTMLGGGVYLFTQGDMGYFFGSILVVVAVHFAEDFYNKESRRPVMMTVDNKGDWKPVKGDETKWK